VQLFRDIDNLPDRFRRCALSIGNFDGVHRGHAELVGRLVATAREMDTSAVAFTFDPHPAQLLRPRAAPKPLGWTGRNAELLGSLGVDAVIAFATDTALLQLEAGQFFDDIIRRRLDARALVEGRNFFFGRNRTGNIDVLREFCRETGVRLEVVEPLAIGGRRVSSSQIRSMVTSGEMRTAEELLGRPYRIRGTVVRGTGRGAKLGYPTANLERIDTLLPGEGIYAARAWPQGPAHAGSSHAAAVNIGPNPTFGEGFLKVEAFLIDFQADLYDELLELDFFNRLRDITRFDSAEELVAQMGRDVADTRRIVKRRKSQIPNHKS